MVIGASRFAQNKKPDAVRRAFCFVARVGLFGVREAHTFAPALQSLGTARKRAAPTIPLANAHLWCAARFARSDEQ
jgi:hypothetical protein